MQAPGDRSRQAREDAGREQRRERGARAPSVPCPVISFTAPKARPPPGSARSIASMPKASVRRSAPAVPRRSSLRRSLERAEACGSSACIVHLRTTRALAHGNHLQHITGVRLQKIARIFLSPQPAIQRFVWAKVWTKRRAQSKLYNDSKSIKVGRDWHHHSRALRHRSMGQGGMTGCRDYAPRQKSFLAACKYFRHG
jgi:hypothetical protein